MKHQTIDKFIVRLESRNKGKVGEGSIYMKLRYDVPYRELPQLIRFLENYRHGTKN